MNEFYRIVAENAELENKMLMKYVGTNEGVVDFVKDKGEVVYDFIKRMYEKVIAAIDELILKFLSMKDKAMVYGIKKKFEKIQFVEGKYYKGKKFTFDKSGDWINPKVIQFNDLPVEEIKLTDDNEKAIYMKISSNKATDKNSLMDYISSNICSNYSDKVKITEEMFESAKKFVSSNDTGAVVVLDHLRRLKLEMKKMYKASLIELKKKAKESLKDAEDNEKSKIREKNNQEINFTKKVFEIVSLAIISAMGLIKEGIGVAGKIASAFGSKDQKALDKENFKNFGADEKGMSNKKATDESFSLFDDIDVAILEADLEF